LKENEAFLGPKTRGGLGQVGGLGERHELPQQHHELPQRGPGQSPSQIRFYCNLISADRLCWQQMAANTSPFRPEKWGYGTRVRKVSKVGVLVPLTPHKITPMVLSILWMFCVQLAKHVIGLMFEGWQFLGWSEPLSLRQQTSQQLLCKEKWHSCAICYSRICLEHRISYNSGVLQTTCWWFAWAAAGHVRESASNKHKRKEAV